MKVTTVRYGRLRSFGTYENIRIEMEATLEESDDANSAILTLKEAVDAEIARQINQPSIDSYTEVIDSKQRQLEEVQESINVALRKLAETERKVKKVESLLKEEEGQ